MNPAVAPMIVPTSTLENATRKPTRSDTLDP